MSIDWEEFKRQRAGVTREEERELAIEIIKFIGRFLWAKLSGKNVVKSWWTDSEGDKMFSLCVRTEEIVLEGTKCCCCFTKNKAGSEMSRLTQLFILEEFDAEDISEILCKECADAITDKERFEEYETACKQKLYTTGNL